MMTDLHEYQKQAVAEINTHIRKGARSILLVAPTGSGKTRMVSAAMRRAKCSVLGLAHRKELCKQISAEFERSGPPNFTVAGVGSHRVGDIIKSQEHRALFVDEAHHVAARSYRRLVENRGDMILIGATATPYRSDGAALAQFFDAVVTTPGVRELSAAGYLARVSYVSSDDVDYDGIKLNKMQEFEEADALRRVLVAVQAGDLVKAWGKYARGKNALIYGINLEHCERIKAELDAANVPNGLISSRTGKKDRDGMIRQFEARKLRAIVNCEVFTEGTDIKGVGAIIMLRPTNSRALYKQMIGRGMRPDVSCVVIDHVGNFLRHGNVLDEDPIAVMNAGRLHEAIAGQESARTSMMVDIERMRLHVEKVDCDLAQIWAPSIFR